MVDQNIINARIKAFYQLISNPEVTVMFYEDKENYTCALGRNGNKPGTYHFLRMDTEHNKTIKEKDYKEEELSKLAMQVAMTMNDNCHQFLYLDRSQLH